MHKPYGLLNVECVFDDWPGYVYSFRIGVLHIVLVIFSVWHETEHLFGHKFEYCSVKQNFKYS